MEPSGRDRNPHPFPVAPRPSPLSTMDVKTYRARTMQDALNLVRRELGPNASVLQTRDVRVGGLFRLLPGMKRVEVTASADVTVPSRLPSRTREPDFNDASGLDLSAA